MNSDPLRSQLHSWPPRFPHNHRQITSSHKTQLPSCEGRIRRALFLQALVWRCCADCNPCEAQTLALPLYVQLLFFFILTTTKWIHDPKESREVSGSTTGCAALLHCLQLLDAGSTCEQLPQQPQSSGAPGRLQLNLDPLLHASAGICTGWFLSPVQPGCSEGSLVSLVGYYPPAGRKGPVCAADTSQAALSTAHSANSSIKASRPEALLCVQEPQETIPGAAKALCRARGRPGRAGFLTQLFWGALSPLPMGSSLRCVTPSPAASLSGGLKLSKPKKKKLNETETSLP